MKSKALWWTSRIAVVLMLAAVTSVLAEPRTPVYFAGVINDFSPASVSPLGPWEIRGQWSLTLKDDSRKADFSAALTMEKSDYWVSANSQNPDMTALRGQHTHHITLVDGAVTPITGGFEITGPVSVTKDGSPAPFSASNLTIDITGGTTVDFSNIAFTFTGGATGHFGTLPIHGVVRRTEDAEFHGQHR